MNDLFTKFHDHSLKNIKSHSKTHMRAACGPRPYVYNSHIYHNVPFHMNNLFAKFHDRSLKNMKSHSKTHMRAAWRPAALICIIPTIYISYCSNSYEYFVYQISWPYLNKKKNLSKHMRAACGPRPSYQWYIYVSLYYVFHKYSFYQIS